MRILLDANVLLDCLVLEANGLPRQGKAGSDQLLLLCDQGVNHGLVAWHTLPIIAYYHGRQNDAQDTASMMDSLLAFLEVPTVTHFDARNWRSHRMADFEDALQVASALAGRADMLVTRNMDDFRGCEVPLMMPEDFLWRHP